MVTMTEKGLAIDLPHEECRFDDAAKHGLSHCMKAVDFVVPQENDYLFIEVTDPGNPATPREQRERFIEDLKSGRFSKEFTYKYRDSWLYEWAAGRADKPVKYLVLIGLDLDKALLLHVTDTLKRSIPVGHPKSGVFKRSIVSDCMVFDLRAWNQYMGRYPVKRISPDGSHG